jgi:hypothetical protein
VREETIVLTDYLQALFVNLFLIVGVYKLMEKGMLLGDFGDWLYDKLEEWLGKGRGEFYSKPLFTCPPCMSSIYGVSFFFAAQLYNLVPWWLFPLHSLALCGLATLAMMIDGTK